VNHFTSIEWVDFARNVVSRQHKAAIQEHLDHGCVSCLEMAKTWAMMFDFVRQEPFYGPPDAAVRIVRSYFYAFRLTLQERKDLGILRHVFDSHSPGMLEGMRGAATGPRQLLYNSLNVFIDLHLERKPGSDLIALTGQVVDAQLSDSSLVETGVLLLTESGMELKGMTNQLGEFTFSFKAARQLGLLLNMTHAGLLLLLPDSLAEISMD
jgi:hypothetical protein